MKNQFFYTRTEGDVTFRDSFNMNKAIRSVSLENGQVLVILDDFHERVVQEPVVKNHKVVDTKNLRQTVQSEIFLSAEDGERFFKLTNIE